MKHILDILTILVVTTIIFILSSVLNFDITIYQSLISAVLILILLEVSK